MACTIQGDSLPAINDAHSGFWESGKYWVGGGDPLTYIDGNGQAQIIQLSYSHVTCRKGNSLNAFRIAYSLAIALCRCQVDENELKF